MLPTSSLPRTQNGQSSGTLYCGVSPHIHAVRCVSCHSMCATRFNISSTCTRSCICVHVRSCSSIYSVYTMSLYNPVSMWPPPTRRVVACSPWTVHACDQQEHWVAHLWDVHEHHPCLQRSHLCMPEKHLCLWDRICVIERAWRRTSYRPPTRAGLPYDPSTTRLPFRAYHTTSA